MVANRINEHVGEGTARRPEAPLLVELRYSVRGQCDFHVIRLRKGVYQIRLGRSADAVVNFRHRPDQMDDTGHSRAWKRLRATLKREGEASTFELEDLDCAEAAMNLAERVGSTINGWRLGTGRTDFPSAAVVAQGVRLPEPMVKVALREYARRTEARQ